MNSSRLFITAALLLNVCTAPAHSMDCPAKANSNTTAKPLAFSEVNEWVHKSHSKAKEEIRAKLGPTIFCTGSTLTLVKGKERNSVDFIKPRYTGLKEVAHITLISFLMLTNHTDENLSAEKIEDLKVLKAGVEKAASRLAADEGLQEKDVPEQQELVKKTLAFLSDVIMNNRVSHSELEQYVQSCARPDLDNAYGAAGSQIAAMDEALTKWHKDMTAEDWNKLHVVIMTSHMPRQELLSFQYFSKLLNVSREGDKIIVAENVNEEEQAMDLLLTHILDGRIAVSFFKDPWRMHRDLLSDGAREYLQKHELTGNGVK